MGWGDPWRLIWQLSRTAQGQTKGMQRSDISSFKLAVHSIVDYLNWVSTFLQRLDGVNRERGVCVETKQRFIYWRTSCQNQKKKSKMRNNRIQNPDRLPQVFGPQWWPLMEGWLMLQRPWPHWRPDRVTITCILKTADGFPTVSQSVIWSDVILSTILSFSLHIL